MYDLFLRAEGEFCARLNVRHIFGREINSDHIDTDT